VSGLPVCHLRPESCIAAQTGTDGTWPAIPIQSKYSSCMNPTPHPEAAQLVSKCTDSRATRWPPLRDKGPPNGSRLPWVRRAPVASDTTLANGKYSPLANGKYSPHPALSEPGRGLLSGSEGARLPAEEGRY
jgi:hypothetical protein